MLSPLKHISITPSHRPSREGFGLPILSRSHTLVLSLTLFSKIPARRFSAPGDIDLGLNAKPGVAGTSYFFYKEPWEP